MTITSTNQKATTAASTTRPASGTAATPASGLGRRRIAGPGMVVWSNLISRARKPFGTRRAAPPDVNRFCIGGKGPPRIPLAGDTRLAQQVDRRRRDDPFDAARQFRVQGYERVCLQLSECDVLGVVRRGPSQLIRQFPGSTPEHGVAEEPDRHLPDAGEAVARDVGRDLAPLDGLVQSRQRLGTKEHRCEGLVLAWDLDLRARQV